MRATGIVRRIDDLGRIVIPKEIRRTMRIREGEPLEIFTENNMICIKKYEPEKKEREKIREYVAQNYHRILSLFSDGDTTTVIFETGKKVSVKKYPTDKFDLTIAIYYAMLKADYKGVE